MVYSNYRDGGTKSFKSRFLDYYFKSDDLEICLDQRIHTDTYGEWYLGYPDKGRLLTQEEKDYLVPEILRAVEADVTWRNHYLEQIKNPQKR